MIDDPTISKWTTSRVARVARSALQRVLLFPVIRFVTPVSVHGGERLRGVRGPVVVAANHVSHMDTPVILRALPRRLRSRLLVAAARDYFYSGRIRGRLVSLAVGAIPFDRDGDTSRSLATCVSALRRGWSILLFPEGTRSPSGELGRVRRGAAVIAAEAGVPILPVHVHGLASVLPKGAIAPLPGGVVVTVGESLAPRGDVEGLRDDLDGALRRLSEAAPSWGSTGREAT